MDTGNHAHASLHLSSIDVRSELGPQKPIETLILRTQNPNPLLASGTNRSIGVSDRLGEYSFPLSARIPSGVVGLRVSGFSGFGACFSRFAVDFFGAPG